MSAYALSIAASSEARFTGTNDDFVSCFNWPVALGRAISHEDVRYARKVCMITQRVQQDLFGGRNPLGEQIRLDADRYTVIGVMAPRVRYGRDAGHEVMISYTTGQKRITGNRHLYGITLFVEALERVEQVEAIVKRVLRFSHEHGDQFHVRTSKQQMESADQTIRIMQMVEGGIVGISLLVGDNGIMNTMLVSVTERTCEIGIRKALGAKPAVLMLQFVVEAIVLSLYGGLLGLGTGVGLGLGISHVIAQYSEVPYPSVVSYSSELLSLGLFFGIYPAVRAARLNRQAASERPVADHRLGRLKNRAAPIYRDVWQRCRRQPRASFCLRPQAPRAPVGAPDKLPGDFVPNML